MDHRAEILRNLMDSKNKLYARGTGQDRRIQEAAAGSQTKGLIL